MKIKNLAGLKRAIRPGIEITAVYQRNHPDIVGLTRIVTEVQGNGFYTKIKDKPNHKYSTCNYGHGYRTDFEKASNYIFEKDSIKVLNANKKDKEILYEMKIFDNGISQKEENTKNYFNNFEMQSQIFKAEYPEGSRIEVICMGDDPHPIPEGTRGTVDFVDDIGTVFCTFDNGRCLGLVPGEDNFRKLTEEEIAMEQRENKEEPDLTM